MPNQLDYRGPDMSTPRYLRDAQARDRRRAFIRAIRFWVTTILLAILIIWAKIGRLLVVPR
jgi:hypothetical protein